MRSSASEPASTGAREYPLEGWSGGEAAGSSSPHALRGVEGGLPAVRAGQAFDPPVPLTFVNPQDGPDDGGIDYVPVLARRPVAEGGRIQRVEPSTRVDAWLVDVFAAALADSPPVPLLDLLPLGLEARVGRHDRASNGMRERLSRSTRAFS